MPTPARSIEEMLLSSEKGEVPLCILVFNVETETFHAHCINPIDPAEVNALLAKLGLTITFD